MNRKCAGFTLLEIIIVLSVIGLLAAICVPRFVKARTASQTSVCVNNLRQIDSAKTMHAIEERKGSGETVDPDSLDPYLKKPFESMVEPANGEYELHSVGENPTCTLGGPHALGGNGT